MTGKEITKQGDAKSRKFYVVMVGLVSILIVVIVCVLHDIPGEEISGILTPIAGIVGAYVIGQGYADGQAVKK